MSLVSTHLRIARPSSDLAAIVRFYRDGLGFDIIDSFEDHDGFDGVMFGHSSAKYHLEFTFNRRHKRQRETSQENLLVFYLPNRDEWQNAVDRMKLSGYEPVPSLNPYWDVDGVTFEDPDGYRVVLQNSSWPK